MKTLFFILGLIITYSSFSQKKIAKDHLISDLDFLADKYEKIHPNLYAYTSKDIFENKLQNLKNEFNDSITSVDFWFKLAPIVNDLKHGHTRIETNQDEIGIMFEDFIKKGYKFLPFSIYVIDSIIYIQDIYTNVNGLKPGDIIFSINGNKSQDIISKLIGYKSGERYEYRLSYVERTFIWDFSFQFPSTSFEIEYLSNGQLKKIELLGITYEDTDKYSSEVFGALSDYTFDLIEDSIGIINYNACRKKEKFKRFLDSTFTTIQQKNIDYLIIDLRKNGGGNSDLNTFLF